MKKKLLAIIVVIVVASCALVLILRRQMLQQPIPDLSPRASNSTVSAEFINAQKAVEHYRELIKNNPNNAVYYVELAQLFLQEGRITGNNAEYLPRAQALLDEAREHDPENSEIIITQASIYATLHKFAEAKELAIKAIAKNPRTPFYYGILCDALVELGSYDEAVKTCDVMVSMRPDLRSYARVSYLRELHGDIDGAISAMKLAAEAGVSGHENRAWVLYNLGTLFLNRNNIDTAEYIFKGILEERSQYPHALTGLARVQSIRGNYKGSITLYQQAISILDEPAFHEALGEVYQVTGNFSEMRTCYDRAEKLYDEEKEMGENNDLEMALFLATHNRNIEEALVLAQRSITTRKSIQGYYVLALALSRNGKYTEAWTAIQQAMRPGTKDATTLYLAGMIADRLGNTEQSKSLLTGALSINPNFSFIYAANARQILEKHKAAGKL